MKLLLVILALLSSAPLLAQETRPLSGKVAYVDTDYILSKMPEIQKMKKAVAKTQDELKQEIQSKQKQLQQEIEQYKANLGGMTDSVRSQTENHLQALDAELQNFPARAQQTLDNARQLYLASAYLKVGNAINAVASENGFSVILPLRISGVDFLFYANQNLNLSNAVLEKLGIALDDKPKKDN